MDCNEFLDRYSEYDDSLVPPAELDRFRAHMSACPDCTRYDRVLRKGRMLARQLPSVEPSGAFVPRLHLRLWQGGDRYPGTGARSSRMAAALPVMTMLMVLGAAAALLAGVGDRGTASVRAADAAIPAAASGRVVALPAALLASGPADARAWEVGRVDRAASSSYSPLTMGLPAYRGAEPRTRLSLSTHATLE